MLVDDLKIKLLEQFDLVVFEDLANLRAKHRLIFDLFGAARHDRFESNQRLVLYSAHKPEQNFLDHIQRAAARIDISNFFILIVCPFDITHNLTQSNRRFGHDYSVIQSLVIPLEQTKTFAMPGFAIVDSLCPLPFSQVFISHSNVISPCCKFQGNIGNAASADMNDIFLGHKAADIRKQLATGQKPVECSICWHNEAIGTTSLRQLALSKYGELLDEGWIDDIHIRDVTWSPSSLCNFRCRICHPESSTTIAVEEMQWNTDLAQKKYLKKLIRGSNNITVNDKVIANLSQLPHLQFLHLLGGEPFIWPQLQDLLNSLITGNLSENITIEFNTNCSFYPESIMQCIVENFKAVEVLLSLDNVGTRFEIERGGTWSDILTNIQRFVKLRSPKVKVKLVTTINLQNVLYLEDVIELSHTLGIDVLWWYLEEPEFLCIDRATEKTKQCVVSKYLHHCESELHKIAVRMQRSPGSDGRDFLAHCQKFDDRRAQSFRDSHAEIYYAMGGCTHPGHVLN
jgi:molybdenum cofactor biosynthesis enzyme MoaA